MPNNITNRVIAKGQSDTLRKLIARVGGEDESGKETEFCFNKIIVPTYDPDSDGCAHAHPWQRSKYTEEDLKCWYAWNRAFWGTKWGAYNHHAVQRPHENQAVFVFDTAWTAPHPVIEALSLLFPSVKFIHEWVDEDSHGSNHGRRITQDGLTLEEHQYDGENPSRHLRKIWKELKGDHYDPWSQTKE